ncbi:unnamed protein product [Allacma fusca]|uniref:Uncharacterized protein n=1 Tax=Allacma fusca TaxID=39272 RepID=A0A8J2NYT3_9HEXA|nr:unnamed protein product [Allacma fusca]
MCCKSQDTASVVESLYAQPASETGRKSSIKDKSIQDAAVPKVEPVPVVEPKVDYNRITFADDLVKIIQIDDSPEAEGTDDVSENNEGEEDDENTEDSL